MKSLDITSLKQSVVFLYCYGNDYSDNCNYSLNGVHARASCLTQEKAYNKQVHLGIEHVINHYIREYTYRVHRMTKTGSLVELMKSRDRETLYKKFNHKWELMLEEEPNLEKRWWRKKHPR